MNPPELYTGPHTVIVIAGPTAVGKTSVSLDLATELHTSIIAADSRQCYKEMTIGTAKPTPEELQRARHYFVDEFHFNVSITAADYEKLALSYLDEIFATRNHAIVVGGTGLYIKALCEGLDEMPPADEAIAARVYETYLELGVQWLRETLQQEDPLFYMQGEISNPSRMLRALIFKRSAGESIINFRTQTVKQRPFRIIKIGLELPREVLYQRVNLRVDQMMEQGLLEEVSGLYPFRHLKNLQTVGYSELFEYMNGRYTLPLAVEKIKQHTRNYAKRQMTWFKKDRSIHWLRADDPMLISRIMDFLQP